MLCCACVLSHVQLFVIPWTIACQAPTWNFPSKDTRVTCHFLLQGIFPAQGLNSCLLHWQAASFATESLGKPYFTHGGGLVAKSCLTLVNPWTVARQAPLPVGFPRQEYGAGCHFLRQGIFLTQGSNLHLQHCRRILY